MQRKATLMFLQHPFRKSTNHRPVTDVIFSVCLLASDQFRRARKCANAGVQRTLCFSTHLCRFDPFTLPHSGVSKNATQLTGSFPFSPIPL